MAMTHLKTEVNSFEVEVKNISVRKKQCLVFDLTDGCEYPKDVFMIDMSLTSIHI